MKSTIVSYEERGKYGNNKYRGNCSGLLIKDLLEYYQPKKVIDPMVGGGTTLDVCQDLGVDCLGLDLNPKYGGFDALNDELPDSCDFLFWHPPYDSIIRYSGNMWGEADPRDLSRCKDYPDFIDKINKVQANLMLSLRKGGRIAILVGDIKKKGKLYSMQKDMAWYGQPEQVVIKAQHNCWSDQVDYGARRNFIPIQHEYLLIFKRDDCYVVPTRTTKLVEVDLRKSTKVTWRKLVLASMEKLGGSASLEDLYREVSGHAKAQANQHWQAKVRQVVQVYDDFIQKSRGEWALRPLGSVSAAA